MATTPTESALGRIQTARSESVPQDAPRTRYIPASDWNKHHPWPTPGGLRWLIFHGHQNGFARCTRKIGARVLIDEAAFLDWVDSQPIRPRSCSRRVGAGTQS